MLLSLIQTLVIFSGSNAGATVRFRVRNKARVAVLIIAGHLFSKL
jgi:hypothetical protein